jgi:hypothetical protein
MANLRICAIAPETTGALVASNFRVEVLSAEGTPLASRTHALRAGEYLQLNRFTGVCGLGTAIGASPRASLVEGAVTPYTGGVDAIVTDVNGNARPGTNASRLLRVELVQTK